MVKRIAKGIVEWRKSTSRRCHLQIDKKEAGKGLNLQKDQANIDLNLQEAQASMMKITMTETETTQGAMPGIA